MKRSFVIERDDLLRSTFLAALAFAQMIFSEFGRVVLTVASVTRTLPQNDFFHGQIRDIYNQMKAAGSTRAYESWKRLLAEQFIAENQELGWEGVGVMPSLDGKRIVQEVIPTSKFNVKQSSAFIEWLYAYGADLGVVFADDERLADRVGK